MRQAKINKPWAVTRLEERGQATYPRPAPDPVKVQASVTSLEETLVTHGKVVDALTRSSDATDQALAQELRRMVADQTRARAAEPVRKAPALER